MENVRRVMREAQVGYEIVCVDDGSTDGSTDLLRAMALECDHLTSIIFRRNFGQTQALVAGAPCPFLYACPLFCDISTW